MNISYIFLYNIYVYDLGYITILKCLDIPKAQFLHASQLCKMLIRTWPRKGLKVCTMARVLPVIIVHIIYI